LILVILERQENLGILLDPPFLFRQFLDDPQNLEVLPPLENHLLLESLEDQVRLLLHWIRFLVDLDFLVHLVGPVLPCYLLLAILVRLEDP
jgi:hypothetical protein